MTTAHLHATDTYRVLIYCKPVMKSVYQKGISLLVLKMNRQFNGWLRPLQLVEATYLLNSSAATTNGICCIGKAEQSGKKGRKEKLNMSWGFCQHFVFIPGSCCAGPETLGVREARPLSYSAGNICKDPTILKLLPSDLKSVRLPPSSQPSLHTRQSVCKENKQRLLFWKIDFYKEAGLAGVDGVNMDLPFLRSCSLGIWGIFHTPQTRIFSVPYWECKRNTRKKKNTTVQT